MKSIVLLCIAILGIPLNAPSEVTPYPLVSGDAPNSHFTIRVGGLPVEACSTAMNVGYAHFAFAGTVKVEITASEPIKTFDISPHRSGITALATGKTLVFELSKPQTLHFQINRLPRFFLFAESAEAKPPRAGDEGVFTITELGVKTSADLVQTKAIQQAINEVAAKNGILFVPPGSYRTGELQMKSGLRMYLAAGAILKGTGSLADHPEGEFGTQLIHFLDCENVRIEGRGVIDGQGRALRIAGNNSSASRSKLIRSNRARNIQVEGVILRDSGTWGVHLIESENLRFTNCKLISNNRVDDPSFPWECNTDGFDPDNSSNVLIEGCFVSSHDDSIAVKLRYGVRRDMRNIVFRDNVVWTVKSALKIGSEVYERDLSNVRFVNNDVIRADRGISVYAYSGGTVRDVTWSGNHFEFIGGDSKQMDVEIKLDEEEGKGQLRDLLIKDNTFENDAKNMSKVRGLDAEHVINGVIFENHVIAGRRRMSAEAARIEISRFVSGVVFR